MDPLGVSWQNDLNGVRSMNWQEKLFFQALSKDRAESANMLEKPSMRGIKSSVVEKYSDQAHFIYELLQNADDAMATNARFILEPDRLIFAHNGSRQFSVTNPAYEDEDSEKGRLGDINAITSIANSNKTEASIGKFGVGFKAVFQYTSTPHIYDPKFRFRIDRFIVPTLLDNDFQDRQPGETLFLFPFDHPERNRVEAYSDISNKLQNLSYPLLFLSHIKAIEFEIKDVLGLYSKNIKETCQFGDTIGELVCLTQNNGDELYDENLWLFSRTDECDRKYSVGFFLDKEDRLRPINEPAFCFFPTKEVTGLNFIIHAPFLLTDSREGIRAGVPHNENMLQKLANLSADALVCLRDIGEKKNNRLINDDVVNIIPFNPGQFSDPANKRKVSFLPFYKSIKEKLSSERLLPSMDGYVTAKNAYWASVTQLPQLFSNEQLKEIVENKEACWVFVSIARDEVQRNSKALFNYLDDLVRTNINEDIIISGRSKEYYYNRLYGLRQNLESIKGISEKFIESQSFEWLHRYYKWLSETKHRTDIARDKPIFLDQDGKAAAAFDKSKHSILFLPVKGLNGYRVVHSELLMNPETRAFAEHIGIKQPSLKDQIYNIILPMYRKGGEVDTDSHFVLFFKYFCKCSNEEVDEFIKLIKDYAFLKYYKTGDHRLQSRGTANSMYMPIPELEAFLETKKSIRFVALEVYKGMVAPSQEKQLIKFLKELGVREEISLITEEIDYSLSGRKDLPTPRSTCIRNYEETNLDGCKELVDYIVSNKDAVKSYVLWESLLKVINQKCTSYQYRNLDLLLRGTCHYFYYTSKEEFFCSSDVIKLRNSAWLVNVNGVFVSSKEATKETLSDQYDTASEAALNLLTFLGISDEKLIEGENKEDDRYLTESQKEKIDFANKIRALGISVDDLEDFKEFKRQKDARKRAIGLQNDETVENNPTNNEKKPNDRVSEVNDYHSNEIDRQVDDILTSSTEKMELDITTSRVVKDIVKRTGNKAIGQTESDQPVAEDLDMDQDEYTPVPVDYSKRIERAKQKSACEIEKIAYYEKLQTRAIEAPKYSYGWFKTLLEMESINGDEVNDTSKEVSIVFAKVEREPGTKRTLVLRYPDRYIPQFMEDLADIPLILHIGKQTKTVAIEVANVRSYTLRVKMKNSGDIEGIDLSTVTSATIDVKSPAFLLEELRKQFNLLGEERQLKDNYDMQKNLCENIKFIFGPPGTGKTTYLAQNVLIPMMQSNSNYKVLVLTPTNKSADVLVNRIIEVSKDTSYNNWLVRFGATGDERIEQSPVFRDKTFDIRTLQRNVTITTIARFPYDFFMPQGARIFLNGINWDYIVIDEASMIPIANIVFALYKKKPREFIIAGDPFQIEPITSVNLWKNENIYTMVQLDSFTNPITVPHQYKIKLLTTQYRSIPDIGYVFSSFAYGGILKHYRSADSQRQINVGKDLGVKTLNIIKFPVSKYESIYRSKRLQHSSSYQIYSALFTFEYVCYLSKAIAKNNASGLFKIGIIAPYRAQADMLDKLLASEKLPKEVDVQVGTIHGFQGDECDIVFAVFNTPPTISASREMFLNKRNIVNVSISRAKDYLFIIMPDDNTEGITNLHLVRRVERLIHDTNAWNEFLTPDLEEMMFGDRQYLENNAFSTSHQSVNVYGLPEKRYEIRTEDSAVDVQLHKDALRAIPKKSIIYDVIKASAEAEKLDTLTERNALDENKIPKGLRKGAIGLLVRGAIDGLCYLVPYTGKLKNHTTMKTTGMFITQNKNGHDIKISVSVSKEERLIYIAKDIFRLYKKDINNPEGIELKE